MPIRRTAPTAVALSPSSLPALSGGATGPRGGVTSITWEAPPDDGGRVWELLAGDPKGASLTTEWAGWRQLKADVSTATATGVDGQRYRGHRFGARSMTLPILLQHSGTSEDMWALWDGWHRSWRYDKPGRLTVHTSLGSSRSIWLRLEEMVNDETHDPLADGWDVIAVGAVADDPHWLGSPITRRFEPPVAGATMFDTESTGYVFNIDSGHTFESATIDNPGDFPVRPDWVVTAPWSSVTLGVGDKVIRYPNASTSPDDMLTVTTSNGSPVVTLYTPAGERNVTSSLTQWGFASVPPGSEVPITVQVDGLGAVMCTITPRYLRPF